MARTKNTISKDSLENNYYEQGDVAEESVIITPRKKGRFKKVLSWIVCIVLLISVFASVYFFNEYQKLKQDPTIQAKKETQRIVDELEKLMIVPEDPNTFLATITDKEKLKGQAFFDKALNGDYVIVFPSQMTAVLYRPSIKKIVSIAPIYSEGTTAGAVATEDTSITSHE